MSRGFNDYEKQVITDSLIKQGKILFSKFGFRKTSIHEITKNVAIAQGTIYKFFNSKEELYFVILEMKEEKLKEEIHTINICKVNQPKKDIKIILRKMVHTVEQHPLIREVYVGRNFETMLNKLSPELLEKHFKNDSVSFLPLVEKLKSKGFVIEEDPEVIGSVIRSLFLLTLHKKEISVDVYQETMDLFIDLIVDGLIKEEGD